MMNMTRDALIFGSPDPSRVYTERRAAYVVIKRGDRVAMVGFGEKHFLPGGGSLPGETPEQTVRREVLEELAQQVRLVCAIGDATQYFYSSDDDCHYKLIASFFTGEIDPVSNAVGELQLLWLPVAASGAACFHECHAWAISQA